MIQMCYHGIHHLYLIYSLQISSASYYVVWKSTIRHQADRVQFIERKEKYCVRRILSEE